MSTNRYITVYLLNTPFSFTSHSSLLSLSLFLSAFSFLEVHHIEDVRVAHDPSHSTVMSFLSHPNPMNSSENLHVTVRTMISDKLGVYHSSHNRPKGFIAMDRDWLLHVTVSELVQVLLELASLHHMKSALVQSDEVVQRVCGEKLPRLGVRGDYDRKGSTFFPKIGIAQLSSSLSFAVTSNALSLSYAIITSFFKHCFSSWISFAFYESDRSLRLLYPLKVCLGKSGFVENEEGGQV